MPKDDRITRSYGMGVKNHQLWKDDPGMGEKVIPIADNKAQSNGSYRANAGFPHSIC